MKNQTYNKLQLKDQIENNKNFYQWKEQNKKLIE